MESDVIPNATSRNRIVDDQRFSPSGGLLQGDVALITGAARGIGEAIARAVAREGAKTFLTDLAEEEIRNIALGIDSSKSPSAFLAADLRDPTSYERIVDAAIDNFGLISIMIHAASPRTNRSIFDFDDLLSDETFTVNLEAGYQIAKRVSRVMIRDGIKGRLLFITSLHARTPRGNPAYSAAKAGVSLVMQELAKALGPHGIRVNAIAPGLVVSNQSQLADHVLKLIPLRRPGQPDEIAEIACSQTAIQVTYQAQP